MNEKIRNVLVRQSETREKLNTLAAVAEPTDSQAADLATLRTEANGIEVELRDALKARDDDDRSDPDGVDHEDAETRERRELRSKARISRFIASAANGRVIDGAEAEVGDAYGCPGLVPFGMFEREPNGRAVSVEHRDVTPAPSTVNRNLGSIVPALFQRSAAAWLGIDMPTVGVGDQGYPVLGTSVTAGVKAKSAAAAESAGAFVVSSAVPRRVTGSFRFQREEAARLSGMEEALRAESRLRPVGCGRQSGRERIGNRRRYDPGPARHPDGPGRTGRERGEFRALRNGVRLARRRHLCGRSGRRSRAGRTGYLPAHGWHVPGQFIGHDRGSVGDRPDGRTAGISADRRSGVEYPAGDHPAGEPDR